MGLPTSHALSLRPLPRHYHWVRVSDACRLAKLCGPDERRYANYANDHGEPDLATLVKIAQTRGTSEDYLLDLTDQKPQTVCAAAGAPKCRCCVADSHRTANYRCRAVICTNYTNLLARLNRYSALALDYRKPVGRTWAVVGGLRQTWR